LFLLVLILGPVLTLPHSFADSILFPGVPWLCPPSQSQLNDPSLPKPSIDKDKDGKVDRKYVQINDSHGNDLQLWCLDHGPTGDFAYYSSAPNRADMYIAGCLLICGRNFGDILASSNSTISLFGNNTLGTRLYDVNGTITGYNHTNYVPLDVNSPDKGNDYHFNFNATSHSYTVVKTKIDATTGEHKIAQAGSRIFSPSINDEERMAFATEIFNPADIQSNPNLVGEISEPDERFFIQSPNLNVLANNEYKSFMILYPAQVEIEKLLFDGKTKSMLLTFPERHRNYVNISIPRDLLDHDENEQFVVSVDNQQIDFEETSSESYRTLTFNVNPDAKQASIIGTKAIPEFGLIIVLTLVISMVGIIAITRIHLKQMKSYYLQKLK